MFFFSFFSFRQSTSPSERLPFKINSNPNRKLNNSSEPSGGRVATASQPFPNQASAVCVCV